MTLGARESQEPLYAIKLQSGPLGKRLGRELVRLLEARETESCVERRQVVALEVLDEGEEGHLFVGHVELLMSGDGAESLLGCFALGFAFCEQAPEGFEPAMSGDELVAGRDLANGDRLQEAVVADAGHQLGQRVFVDLRPWLVGVRIEEFQLDSPGGRWNRGMDKGRDRRTHAGSGFGVRTRSRTKRA